ncbi:MAG: fatty acid--CoA ligase family protein, partial [candidate division Zixibacteria bacterium]|nr:fatty acid--CoA ligase family protein [candidate division Zixibacteria bacterium]
EETAKVLKMGSLPWERILYTGDLFKMDEEGFLYFVGRRDDIIKCRGEKVSPKEIENILYNLEGVLETAVVGVPDEILGQAIKAFVVLKEGVNLSEKDILRYCSKNLEDFMVPKYVELVETLPKTESGKIKKVGLK